METRRLVRMYFCFGMQQKEILACLSGINNIIISRRTLQRILKQAGLMRRKAYSNILNVALFLVEEVEKSSQLHGYKFMHLKCIQSGYTVSQETVRLLLQVVDPEGVESRRRGRIKRRLYASKGPNFLWHVDSYDKLKPYGICINGAIDGFSRKIVWLRAYNTNSDLKIIAGYFVDSLKSLGGCPVRIRADKGTENGHVQQMQEALRFEHTDTFARKSFIYGSSNHNQRIESWWAFLRRHNAQYWISKFSSLKDADLFVGDFIDKNLIQFVFLNIIQAELDEITTLWNCHRIRPTRGENLCSGRPLLMYSLPHLYNTYDCLCQVSERDISVCEDECTAAGPYPCDKVVFDLCCIIMDEKSLAVPRDPEEGFGLYRELRQEIRSNF